MNREPSVEVKEPQHSARDNKRSIVKSTKKRSLKEWDVEKPELKQLSDSNRTWGKTSPRRWKGDALFESLPN